MKGFNWKRKAYIEEKFDEVEITLDQFGLIEAKNIKEVILKVQRIFEEIKDEIRQVWRKKLNIAWLENPKMNTFLR